MAHITVEKYLFQSPPGRLFHSGTPEEALEFVQGMTKTAAYTSGWIKNEWGSSHISAHKDGLGAVFTNGVFDEGDRQYYYNLIGKEATDVLLRHHSIRKR